VGIAKSFGMEGSIAENASQLSKALKRAAAANREGAPYLIDLKVKQGGHGANENWYPALSVADKRSRKI
jgi:thiamine pyrophosphate-dependent acetolactate synthase large subunit-like protein